MSYQSEIALMGRRGANAFRKNDAVRALQSARDDGLEPTGMQVSIAANGDVVFRIYTTGTMPTPSKEIMTSAEWDAETEKLRAKKR